MTVLIAEVFLLNFGISLNEKRHFQSKNNHDKNKELGLRIFLRIGTRMDYR